MSGLQSRENLFEKALTTSINTGTRLGRYEIRSQLGAGGMGEVYLAEDTRLGRRVALKVLPESIGADTDRLLRFEREAQAASALNHPNILTVRIWRREGRSLSRVGVC
ncbi:MAG: hypothetical protein H0U60_13845 [Blastocatellia bacterium]|nr:hypothetical protein [Blastocatellia bacterium]